ncbi:serine/threonine-protein kinase [Nocardia gipuzkoensis]|uniref:serine/threonine-protein kinase n=1 Tax=Nocardia gipuzkoensis TaxID=2749991 RepID=UPI00237E4D95|nr:serine/threonine-protein kinase [Nocardia gipuzkoensis]MDE1673467.1 serine/threonine-protein kinase [Nocardia gipuzkoensis]
MAALEPGSVFAGYTIERLLGAGGMGEVYVARHPRLPRSDAVKVLAAQFTRDDSYRRRFEREADLAASLSHPGIVSVHDRGESEGRLWIALELIDGIDLSASLAGSPGGLPGTDVARAIMEVADALDYAGARGLVHRDVKPANILLASTGHYLLTDFGIARMGPETSDLTGTGLTIGTIAYASPEQAQGLPVEPRSDQYSLAATAFHLLTGAQPFTGANPVAVIMAHAQQPVPSVRAHRPDLAPHVDSVIERAMAKSPVHRFPTSKDFATALGHALAVPGTHRQSAAGTAAPTAAVADRYAETVVRSAPLGRGPQHPASPMPRRTMPRLIGAMVVTVALVVVGLLGVRAFMHDAGAEEAARLPHRPVTPILPSLDKRPDTAIWTLQDIPGPPGSQSDGASALGGDSDVVIFSRRVRLADANRIKYLDIVDANTGRLRAGTEPIMVDTSQRSLSRCVVSASHSAAACHLDGSSAPSDAVVVIDLEASRIIDTFPAVGQIDSLTAAGGRFVFVDRTVQDQLPALRTIGADGRELPAIRWTDAHPRSGSTQPRHSIEVFDSVRLAVVKSAPDPSEPLSKWEFRVIRLEDGNEVFRRDSVEEIGDKDWNVFIDGFVVADGRSPAGIYDRNGTKTADLPKGWRPSERPTRLVGPGPVETSVPTAIRTQGNRTTYAGISPRNGTVLWQNESFGVGDSPERLLLRGTGSLILTSESGRVVDAYTGEYVIPGLVAKGTELGTDGSRIAVGTDSARSGHSLEVWSSDGEVWEITTEYPPVAIGGKVYVGNLRLF